MQNKERGLDINPNKAKLLVAGTFNPDQVVVDWQNTRMTRPQDFAARRGTRWQDEWFAGPLVRHVGYSLDGSALSLQTRPTAFDEYVCSRSMSDLRSDGPENLANPISTSNFVVTADGQIVLIHKKSGDATGSIDLPGGYLHPTHDLKDGRIDPFMGSRREVAEEVIFGKDNLSPEEFQYARKHITQHVCLGLIYEYKDLCHPVMPFRMVLGLTKQELMDLRRQDGLEVELVFVPPSGAPNVLSVINSFHPNVEPDGRTALALGRRGLSGKEDPAPRILKQFGEI